MVEALLFAKGLGTGSKIVVQFQQVALYKVLI